MKIRKSVALLLAAVMMLSVMHTMPASAAGQMEDEALAEVPAVSSETPSVSPEGPAVTSEGPVEEPTAVIDNLQKSYQEDEYKLILSYETTDCAYIKIYVNGTEQEDHYTGNTYEYMSETEAASYEFRMIPYNDNDTAGEELTFTYTFPYKKAVVTELDVEYNLDKKVLMMTWSGKNIKNVDVYQDNEKIAEKTAEGRLVLTTTLAESSEHIYRIVPYNRNNEAGTEKIYLLKVSDYTAKINRLTADYNPKTKLLSIEWSDTYGEYADILLNGKVLVQNWTEKEAEIQCNLQPGASYTISILPYNFRDEPGEMRDTVISYGSFDAPADAAAFLVSVPVADKAGDQTGFSKPQVHLKWNALAGAVYEIYRAREDSISAYKWFTDVKANADGVCTYVDESAEFGSYFYKIRRKIAVDSYIDQELYTALSKTISIQVAVLKPRLSVKLNETGSIALSMKSSQEFVSGYDIYRKSGKGKFKFLTSVTEDEYMDSEIEFGKTYRYKVKAFYYDMASGKKTTGGFSNVSKVKNTIGSIQAEVTAVSAKKIKLTWTPAANAEGYEIYFRSGTPGDSYALWQTTEKMKLKKNVRKNGTYYFMVKAYRTAGKNKTYFSSAEVSIKMGFAEPTGFKIKKTAYEQNAASQVIFQKDTLSWNRVYGAKGYYIDVYDAGAKKYRRLGTITKGTVTSYTVSNPVTTASRPVKYRISTYAGSNVKKGGIIEITPKFGSPKNVTAERYGTKTRLRWDFVPGAECYQIYRSNGRTMVFIGETTGNSIVDQGLSAGVGYNYYVQAVNRTQKLISEKTISVSYVQNQEKVANLEAVNIDTRNVQITWNESRGAEKYIIYYKSSSKEDYQILAEVSAKINGYLHKKRAIGSTCYYKVTAVKKNSGGILSESGAASTKVKIKK